jgi:hypothetical protein
MNQIRAFFSYYYVFDTGIRLLVKKKLAGDNPLPIYFMLIPGGYAFQ